MRRRGLSCSTALIIPLIFNTTLMLNHHTAPLQLTLLPHNIYMYSYTCTVTVFVHYNGLYRCTCLYLPLWMYMTPHNIQVPNVVSGQQQGPSLQSLTTSAANLSSGGIPKMPLSHNMAAVAAMEGTMGGLPDHSGDYNIMLVWQKIDGIIRMNSVTISVNHMSDSWENAYAHILDF